MAVQSVFPNIKIYQSTHYLIIGRNRPDSSYPGTVTCGYTFTVHGKASIAVSCYDLIPLMIIYE